MKVPADVTSDPGSTTTDWRFAPIPDEVLYDRELDPLAVRVYGCLMRHGLTPAGCYPSHARIGSLIHVAKRSVARPLRDLEAAGWVSRHPRYDARGDRLSDGFDVHTTRASGRAPHANERGAPPANERVPPAPTSAVEREPDEREPDQRGSATAAPPPSGVPAVVLASEHLEEARQLCRTMAAQLAARGHRVPPDPCAKAWLVPMEALMRIDGHEPAVVAAALRWLEGGTDRVVSFWRPVILSPANFRQHFVTMREQLAAARTGSSSPKSAALHPPGRASLTEAVTAAQAPRRSAVEAVGSDPLALPRGDT